MKGVFAVAMKELRQIVRDRRTLIVLLFTPVFFLFLYGYALNFDIRHIGTAVENRDGSPESRALVAAFGRSGYFDLNDTAVSPGDADDLMNRGAVEALLVIPADFGRLVRGGQTADVQVILDGANANTATTVMGYANGVLSQQAAALGGAARASMVTVEPRVWYNPELRSTLFLVPGLIAYIATITAVVSTALSIVREKEQGTMEQVRMAPLSTSAYVAGKTLPYLVISQLSAMFVILASMALFALPMRGNWLALSLVLALFLVGALGTGLLVSTIANTQQVALQMSMLIAFLPTFILSGFIFPISSMPKVLQIITTAVPARYFLVALRGILLKGLTLGALWQPCAAMSVYAVVVLGLASLRLSRQ